MTVMATEVVLGDRDRTIMAMVVARAWRDPELKAELMRDPKGLLVAEGVEFPDHVEIRVVEDTPTAKHINLTGDVYDTAGALEVIGSALPIPKDFELRIVQSTPEVYYLVLPSVPEGLEPMMISETDMMRAAVPNVPYAKVYLYQYAAVGVAAAADVAAAAVVVIVLT